MSDGNYYTDEEKVEQLEAAIGKAKTFLNDAVDHPGFEVEGNEASVALRMNLLCHKALAILNGATQ